MLHGPWREAGAPTVVLHIDDSNIDSEAIAIALAYLYGQPPKLNDNNAFRVLAAASFMDLQVCSICESSYCPQLFAIVLYLQMDYWRACVQSVHILLFLSFGHQTFYNIRLVHQLIFATYIDIYTWCSLSMTLLFPSLFMALFFSYCF